LLLALVVSALSGTTLCRAMDSPAGGARNTDTSARRLKVPSGFIVEKVAGPPLVWYPMLACLDDRGRLFVAEGTGTNLPGSELEKLKRGRITMLEDTDGDGRFDRSTVFADKLIFPTGVLPHGGAVFGASHPSIWRFVDRDGDGRADDREELVTSFNFNGNGCDIHGPFPGPDGRIYWTDGRHGYKVPTREGPILEGLASRVWRCRPDGREIERLCGGGFDNPVELAFTEEGEMIGTMDQGPGDALLHYVEGGVYPMDHPCVKEFPMTGPMLGSISQYSAALPVALCGLMRYRSRHFGSDYENTFLTAQFNVHRIQQHVLLRDGSTFRSIDKDFLTANDYDFHPTDVLEDADGSLLVVDMGAWFNYGCPTSKIAQPEVLGGIYRIRRQGATRHADPWGRTLKWAELSPEGLVPLLDDPRPKVRERAIEQVLTHGSRAVAVLAAASGDQKTSGSPSRASRLRRNALWALSRIDTDRSREAIRARLADGDPSVRQVAVHCAGLARDVLARSTLETIVLDDTPPIRLKAAEGLGRIGRSESIPALLNSIRKGTVDRFLEHAIIYALIRINDAKSLQTGLADPNPNVRRAGLIAMDQMTDRRLAREQVLPLLDTDDVDLQEAALAVIGREESWSADVVGLLRRWLSDEALPESQTQWLAGVLLALSRQANVQDLITESLNRPETSVERRLILLSVIGRSRVDQLPFGWLNAVGKALDHEDDRVRREAVATIRSRSLKDFDESLKRLSLDTRAPVELRVAALDCVASRLAIVDSAAFELLVEAIGGTHEPLLQVGAARALGSSALDDAQLIRLADEIADAGPLVVPSVLPAFARSTQAAVGARLVAALAKAPGTSAIPAENLLKTINAYPTDVKEAARPLIEEISARQQKKEMYMVNMMYGMARNKGTVKRGREVFFAKKTGCIGCHRMDHEGGTIGPDLSRIGRVRSIRDLLESILYPSSTIVPAYRPYIIATKDGRQTQGIIVRETSEAVFLRTSDLAEIRIPVKRIEEMRQSDVSIMPQGLEKTMTQQELGDLLAFLMSR
jgi:putative heme-binding domain-containing protein